MVLILDNYDSFTYNLVQYAWQLGHELEVYRNDEISTMDIKKMRPEKIVISPGPGRPEDAGISVEVVKEFASETAILGVCLGHQAIATAFGGRIIQAPEIIHGKTSRVIHNRSVIFKNVPETFEATRYHSLVVEQETLPEILGVTAQTDDGLIMALEHRQHPVYGVQFHPESIATGHGMKIMENFLSIPSTGGTEET
ncbi:MAG: anthranilate synthase component II [Fidelibacterota bacterium]